jgi:putative tryptophan/tyrosine transport system substrate-binding protein
MKRRDFIIAAISVAAVSAPLFAWAAQQAGNIPRIGFLSTFPFDTPEARRVVDAFRRGLREQGYVESQSIIIEYRESHDHDRLLALARELVGLKVDVILAPSTPAARAAQQATTTIPIVAAVMQDPVGDGLVASLARPGGNITGLSLLSRELIPKRMELLKEALPSASHIAVLWDPNAFGEGTTRDFLKETEGAGQRLGVALQLTSVRGPGELDHAFSAIAAEHADALLALGGPMIFSERRRIVELTGKHHLPSVFNAREFVELGGLISYGASVDDLNRRSATFVDKILKGAKPSDLPVEQPTKFELVINLKTAKALGVEIPGSLLARADEVIE